MTYASFGRPFVGRFAVIAGLGLLCASPARADDKIAFFEAKIRPVLVEQCYSCHSTTGKKRGGLLLDSKDAVHRGGDSGPAIKAGSANDSLLVKAIRYGDPDLKMPPKGKLPAAVIADFERWIAEGAVDPRDGKETKTAGLDFDAARKFWSFQKPVMPKIPDVKNAAWTKTTIDRFILAKLEAEKLQPAPTADPRTLIRRLSFDLTGLPPTPEEIDAFVADKSPDAYAKLVDRLLSSPHYGERWGRYWLDVARYAEDQAHTFGVKPNTQAFRYRDWVIDAINADMPYDRFVKLQIAADQMSLSDEERTKQLPALGFFGLGAQYYKNSDAAKAAADELDDRIDTLSRAFLGLTVSCARCHDHKFDPIPQMDYYSLAGIFSSCKLSDVLLAPKAEVAKYQEGQGKIKKIDDATKAFLKDERTAFAEQSVLRRRSISSPRGRPLQTGVSAKDVAKKEKLPVDGIDRWVKFVQDLLEGGRVRRLPTHVRATGDGRRGGGRDRGERVSGRRRRRDGGTGREEDDESPGGAARRLLRREGAVHDHRQRHQEAPPRGQEGEARRIREGDGGGQEGVSRRCAAVGPRPRRGDADRHEGVPPRKPGQARRSRSAALPACARWRRSQAVHARQRPTRSRRGHRDT